MKTSARIGTYLLAGSWAFAAGAPPANPTLDTAIQALQQAADPSAAVTAFANGFALDRNNPKLYDAYVSRMVDLGLPEMAYHQAQTLTTLQTTNGLAWGVVAYVDARRAQMPEALAAINLAGRFTPDNKFVQHTAGELVAWYDLKADKASLPDNTKEGLTIVRILLGKQTAYTEAYSTAQKAYQTPTSATEQPTQAAPVLSAPAPSPSTPGVLNQVAPTPMVPDAPQVPMAPQIQADQVAPLDYAAPAPAPPVYPDYSSYPDYSGAYLDWGPNYCYGWGPGWVAPSPWCWWQPCGYWGGCDFFPFGAAFAFGGDGDFDHFHHGHDGHFGHGGGFGHGHDPAFWHNGSQAHNGFFGTPAQPSAPTAHFAQANSPVRLASTSGTHWWSGTGQHGPPATAVLGGRSAPPNIFAHNSTASAPIARSWSGSSSAVRSTPSVSSPWAGRSYSGPSYSGRSYSGPSYSGRGYSGPSYSYAPRSYAAPRSSWSVPSYRAPGYAAPRYTAPSRSYSGGFSGWRGSAGMSAVPRSFGGGFSGFHGGSSFGGGSHSGGFGGGGSHGGGGFGGGHGGGGHR